MAYLAGLLTLVACSAAAGLGRLVFGRWLEGRDPAFAWGAAGAFGLGLVGWITLPVGLLPGGLRWGIWLVLALLVGGLFWLYQFRDRMGMRRPEGSSFAIAAVLATFGLIAFLCAIGPSDSLDWDTLAYHLAVPKIWIDAGQIVDLRSMHQSNFPFVVDNLYIWGLQWGGEAGAKAFMAAFFGLGMLSAFGLARERWGPSAGWWAALAFAGIPVAFWEAGTAYVDVPHGLFAGIGMWSLARWLANEGAKEDLGLAAVGIGFAAASKYTGLQVAAAAIAVSILVLIWQRQSRRLPLALAMPSLGLLLLAGPWLLKNALTYGNPFYPFFYEIFGSQNWDAFAAAIYKNEQQTFGVGRTESGRDLTQIGHAILGLAYQPGRFVNPGQTLGLGFPTGALGFAALAAGVAFGVAGRPNRADRLVLAMIGLLLGMWFILSQQSRYLLIVGFPLAVYAGAAAAQLRIRMLMQLGIAAQAAYSMWLVGTTSLTPKLDVLSGRISLQEFRVRRIGAIAAAAPDIAALPASARVALYDEVFGFLLDRPYFWANPGHSTMIPYPELKDGAAYARAMQELGFTHVYLSLRFWTPEDAERWIRAAGLTGMVEPYPADEAAAMLANREVGWRFLLADAIAKGQLRPVKNYGSRALLLEFVGSNR